MVKLKMYTPSIRVGFMFVQTSPMRIRLRKQNLINFAALNKGLIKFLAQPVVDLHSKV